MQSSSLPLASLLSSHTHGTQPAPSHAQTHTHTHTYPQLAPAPQPCDRPPLRPRPCILSTRSTRASASAVGPAACWARPPWLPAQPRQAYTCLCALPMPPFDSPAANIPHTHNESTCHAHHDSYPHTNLASFDADARSLAHLLCSALALKNTSGFRDKAFMQAAGRSNVESKMLPLPSSATEYENCCCCCCCCYKEAPPYGRLRLQTSHPSSISSSGKQHQ